MSWISVAIGGAVGAAARYGIQTFIGRFAAPFPVAIFSINIAGSALIGLLAGAMASARVTVPEDLRLFLVAGILGGFTTFSSFSLDTLVLARDGHLALAVLNVAGQVIVSLVAVYVGFRLGS